MYSVCAGRDSKSPPSLGYGNSRPHVYPCSPYVPYPYVPGGGGELEEDGKGRKGLDLSCSVAVGALSIIY